LEGGEAEITATYPAGIIGNTSANLKAAAAGEKMEWGTLYPSFAETAEKEGFKKIAQTFRNVAKVENWHEKRYLKLLGNVENDQVFKKPNPVKWICRNCGYVFEGKNVPDKCPVCDHPRAFYEMLCENY
jgi:rubrerythrin